MFSIKRQKIDRNLLTYKGLKGALSKALQTWKNLIMVENIKMRNNPETPKKIVIGKPSNLIRRLYRNH